jgi:phosphoribosylformylglycinamidine synthase
MVGIIEDLNHITTIDFKHEGQDIYLVGETKDEIGGTEYLKAIHNKVKGIIPEIDLEIHKHTIEMILELIKAGIVASAQDISDGGLAVALAECCFSSGIGADVTIESDIRSDALLFGESQSRVIFTALPENKEKIWEIYGRFGVPVRMIGTTGGKLLKINDLINAEVKELRDIYENAIPSYMGTVSEG